jgi:hypothetical protein
MNTLMDLRLKLQKRVARLQTVDHVGINLELTRFFNFFDANPTLRAIASELSLRYPQIATEVETAKSQQQHIVGLTEDEHAAIGLVVLRKVSVPDNHRLTFTDYVNHNGHFADMLNAFRERYLDPFYEYVDEHIEDRNVVLAELVRFKHLAEWFRRDRLWEQWNQNTGSGEKTLALSLYEFLYEQGIEFYIEPASASGEADLVSAQRTSNRLVADVKIFDPSSGRGSSYIKRGFHQVHSYLNDFNLPIGYLIVYRVSAKEIELQTAAAFGDEVPFVTLGDKTIFLIQVDIFPHKGSASTRPAPEREVISESDLQLDVAKDEA